MTAAVLTSPGSHGPRLIDSAGLAEGTEQLPGIDLDDSQLIALILAGDEGAFATLVRAHYGSLKRFVRTLGATDAVADEVVQETWIVALQGIDSFEQRGSLKAWLYGIAGNVARRRSERERRTVPLSSLAGDGGAEAGMDAARFLGPGEAWAGHWSAPPRAWEDPERRLASLEARALLREAMEALPERQRAVVALRDVEGLSSGEVCDLLDLTEANQRVLLHRGRTAVRAALEEYFDD